MEQPRCLKSNEQPEDGEKCIDCIIVTTLQTRSRYANREGGGGRGGIYKSSLSVGSRSRREKPNLRAS